MARLFLAANWISATEVYGHLQVVYTDNGHDFSEVEVVIIKPICAKARSRMALLSRTLFAFLLLGMADVAEARRDTHPLPLAPDVTEPACDPQPPDDEKLLKALAYLISRYPETRPAIEVDGEFSQMDGPPLTIDQPLAVLLAQPKCCWIAYDDRESPRAPYLRDRLGDNFGGFAYARIGDRARSGQYAGRIFLRGNPTLLTHVAIQYS